RRRIAVFVEESSFVTLKQPPAAAVAHLVRVVGHEHVQHLSRADAVDHLDAKGLLPLFAQMRRQRLARRDTQAQAGTVESLFRAMVFEQQVVDDGHTEEDRRTAGRKDSRDGVRRGFLATQNSRRAVQQWEGKTVAEAVSKGQTR